MTFHYINDLGKVFQMIMSALREEGSFIFSIEHPIFTAEGSQNWVKTEDGKIVWPVDTYFKDGERQSEFLGHTITKVHRSLTTLVKLLKDPGFILDNIVEPTPELKYLESMPDEWRRPMMIYLCLPQASM